jgi:hypothetical protein
MEQPVARGRQSLLNDARSLTRREGGLCSFEAPHRPVGNTHFLRLPQRRRHTEGSRALLLLSNRRSALLCRRCFWDGLLTRRFLMTAKSSRPSESTDRRPPRAPHGERSVCPPHAISPRGTGRADWVLRNGSIGLGRAAQVLETQQHGGHAPQLAIEVTLVAAKPLLLVHVQASPNACSRINGRLASSFLRFSNDGSGRGDRITVPDMIPGPIAMARPNPHCLSCCDAQAAAGQGQYLPPTVSNVAAELASTPDAKARSC